MVEGNSGALNKQPVKRPNRVHQAALTLATLLQPQILSGTIAAPFAAWPHRPGWVQT